MPKIETAIAQKKTTKNGGGRKGKMIDTIGKKKYA